jgi:hypothetical protein
LKLLGKELGFRVIPEAMNGYKVVFVMIIHGIIEGCLQESREKQHHLNILRSSKRFFGNQPTYQKRELKVVEQLPRRPRLRMFDMKLASRTGMKRFLLES